MLFDFGFNCDCTTLYFGWNIIADELYYIYLHIIIQYLLFWHLLYKNRKKIQANKINNNRNVVSGC